MKTLTLKVLGCAAAMSLLTIARAQDDTQAVPPPDTSAPQTDTAPLQQGGAQQQQVIVVPVQTDTMGSNGNVVAPPDNGANMQPMQPTQNSQPMQNMQPNQFRQSNGQNQFQNRNNGYNNDRGGRGFNRGGYNGRDNGGQQRGINSVPINDPNMFTPPTSAGTNGTDGLILNFRDAQIEQVLNYLSDAAGFIIQLDTRVSGTISVWSAHPVSKSEVVDILNQSLAKNGYYIAQSGRILRVMSSDDALHSQIPVIVGNDPDQIPQTDVKVTQIIPVRYVSARQLISDLSLLTPSHAIIMANDAGNSIIVTDTQENIHHLAELVKAIDTSAEDVTEVKPFPLKHHDPVEVANLITQVFADQSGQNGGQAPIRFGGGLGGFGGFFGGGRGGGFGGFGGGRGGGFGGQGGQGGQQGGNSPDRIRQHAKVVAVADQRTQSVIVTAPKDMMAQVEELVTQIDIESPKVAKVSVIHLENADAMEVQKALQAFAASNGRTTSTTTTSPLTQRANQNYNSSSSTGFGSSGIGGGGNGFGGGGGGFGGGGFGGGGVGGGGRGFGQ